MKDTFAWLVHLATCMQPTLVYTKKDAFLLETRQEGCMLVARVAHGRKSGINSLTCKKNFRKMNLIV